MTLIARPIWPQHHINSQIHSSVSHKNYIHILLSGFAKYFFEVMQQLCGLCSLALLFPSVHTMQKLSIGSLDGRTKRRHLTSRFASYIPKAFGRGLSFLLIQIINWSCLMSLLTCFNDQYLVFTKSLPRAQRCLN